MPSPTAADPVPRIPFKRLLTAVSDPTRWLILSELLKGEALPVVELARRLKVNPSTTSKHAWVLRRCGILLVGYGTLYRISPSFLVPGEPNALDFGAVVLRLDQMPGR